MSAEALSDEELVAAYVKVKGLSALSDDQLKAAYKQAKRNDLKKSDPSEYDPTSPQFRAKYGATSGKTEFQNALTGYSRVPWELARGAGQYVGAVSRQNVADARERDAELMSTKGGKLGSIAGNVMTFAPTALIPGANTVTGAALTGGVIGALQPSESTGETIKNTGMGALFGGGSLVAGRGLAAGYRGGKALVEPLTQAGQQRIASRTLEAFAGGRPQAQQAAGNIRAEMSRGMLPGYKPTTSELAGNAGISQLERTVKNNPEYLSAFADRTRGNTASIVDAVDTVAQGPSSMQAAVAARKAAADSLYPAAKAGTARADADFGKLMTRPSMGKGWERAKALAAEAGESLPSQPDMSGQSLHYLKMAMDDLADNPAATGIAGNEARAVKSTRDAFLSWLEKQIPEYETARTTYAQMSRPINQMEVGQALRDKLVPALGDFAPAGGGTTGLRPAAFADAMRNGDAVAARVLDRSSARIADVMDPSQMATLNKVGQTLSRKTTNENLGRAVGSNTGQNIVSQNVVRQFMGPLGLPESMTQRVAESTLLQTVMRPVGFVGRLGEQRAMGLLAEAALDPQVAEEMLRLGVSPQKVGLLQYQGLLAPSVVSGANATKQ